MPLSKSLQYALTQAAEEEEEADCTFLTGVDVRKLPPIKGTTEAKKATQRKPSAPSGFDRLHLSLRKVMGRMGANSGGLDDKWDQISKYVDGFYNQADSYEAAHHYWDIYNHAAKKTMKLSNPNAPMIAVSCALLDHILFWFGSTQPVMQHVAAAVRQQVYCAIFKGDLDDVPRVLKNSQLDASTFEAAASRYMRATYFDASKQLDHATSAHTEISKALKDMQSEVTYWKEAYQAKVFTAWRAHVNAQTKIKKERSEMLGQLKVDLQRVSDLEREKQQLLEDLEAEKQLTKDLRKQLREAKEDAVVVATERARVTMEMENANAVHIELAEAKRVVADLRSMLHNLLQDLKLSALPPNAAWSEKMEHAADDPHSFLLWFFNSTITSQPGGDRYTVSSLVEGEEALHDSLMIFLHVLLPPALPRTQLENLLGASVDAKSTAIYSALEALHLDYMPVTPQELHCALPGPAFELVVAMLFARFADPKAALTMGNPPLGPRLRRTGHTGVAERLEAEQHLSWVAQDWQPAIAKALAEGSKVRSLGILVNERLLGENSEDTRLAGRYECGIVQAYTLRTAAEQLMVIRPDADLDSKEVQLAIANELALKYGKDVDAYRTMDPIHLLEQVNELLALRGVATQIGTATESVIRTKPAAELHRMVMEELKRCGVQLTPPITIEQALQHAFHEFKVRSLQSCAVELGRAQRDTVGVLTRKELREMICSEINRRTGIALDKLTSRSDAELLTKGARIAPMETLYPTPEPPEAGEAPPHSSLAAVVNLSDGTPTPAPGDNFGMDFPGGEILEGEVTEMYPGRHNTGGNGSMSQWDRQNAAQLFQRYCTHIDQPNLEDVLPNVTPKEIETIIDQLFEVVRKNLPTIHDTFRYYSATTANHWTMCEQEFWKFCSDCKLISIDNAGSREYVSLMFADANTFKSLEEDSRPATGATENSQDGVHGTDLELLPGEFLKAIIKISNFIVEDPSQLLPAKVETLVHGYLEKYAQKVVMEEFKDQIYRPEVQQVLKKNKKRLVQVFKYYARAGGASVPKAKQKLDAIEPAEFKLLCKDAKLIDAHCSHETIDHIFIYILEKDCHMFIYEFMEAIVALAAIKLPNPLQPLSVRVQQFIANMLLPPIIAKVRQ
eukprot:TRINITY_DN66721_c4_g1_i1.p1 TRINITY_DN66721_c4_g1~~TRINITY_DN66721_c4_g1_i1.p1  ORF type:complete len:1131 (+),score=125.60 TRINITY_DN66721_c4_g1_i1:72-3464(+)